jgi:hypothetical protein
MATNFSSDLKQTAKKSLVKSFLGTGVVGRAAMKSFTGKEEEGEDIVGEALQEQSQLQNDNNAAVVRIESVVVNIADNVYNIAGVWAERVASMEEAKKEQQQRISKDQAALEEAENEAARQLAPLPSGTSGADVMSRQETSEKGLIGKLADSVKGMGGLLRGVMGKVGLLAAGLGVAGVAVAGGATSLMGQVNAQDTADIALTPSSDTPLPMGTSEQAGAERVSLPPSITSTGSTSTSTASSSPSGGMSGTVSGTSSAPGGLSGAVGGMSSAPGGVTPAPQSSKSAAGGLSGSVMSGSLDMGGLAGASPGSPMSPGGLSGVMGSLSSSAGGLTGGGGDTSTSPGGLSGTSGNVSIPASSLNVTTPSSLGSDISNMSTERLPEQTQQIAPVVLQTNNNTVDDQTQDSPLPSPIADRGSLDLDVYFRARYD